MRPSRHALIGCLLAGLVTMGCAPSLPTATDGASKNPRLTNRQSEETPAAAAYTGKVLGLDGQPAAGVTVRGYLISNNGGGLISNNGGGLISDRGGSYQVLQAGLVTQTDAEGRFTLADPAGRPLNMEAVASDELKAIRMNVSADASELTLQLAPVGHVAGKVTAPHAPGVTNFEGVDVFVPGTSYTAKTDQSGAFTLSNLPPGTFTVVATKGGLGRAEATGVAVESKKTTAADLQLLPATPTVTGLSVTSGGPGAELTISGLNFGASEGTPFFVSMGGGSVAAPERVDDETIKLKVPDNATTGDVTISVGGLQSNPTPFTVLRSLHIPTVAEHMIVGETLKLSPLATATTGRSATPEAITWSATGTAIQVDEAGKVGAVSAGEATLTIRNGKLSDAYTVQVHDAPAIVVTVAGSNVGGHADGIGIEANFRDPQDFAIDAEDHLYIADTRNHLIRKVTPDGVVTTFAGRAMGYADGLGTSAKFNEPSHVAVSPDGGLWVMDRGNYRLRKIDKDGQVTTVAGGGEGLEAAGAGRSLKIAYSYGLVVDKAGNAYFTEYQKPWVRKVTPDGTVSLFVGHESEKSRTDGDAATARFESPSALAIDGDDNLYVTDTGGIRKVTPAGVVETLTTTRKGGALAIGPDGSLYGTTNYAYYDSGAYEIWKREPGGTESTFWKNGLDYLDGPLATAKFDQIQDLVFDSHGDMLVLDDGYYQDAAVYIRKIRFKR